MKKNCFYFLMEVDQYLYAPAEINANPGDTVTAGEQIKNIIGYLYTCMFDYFHP